MMNEMFKEFDFNDKTDYRIEEVNGVKLPKDYLDFMAEHDGGEGPIGKNNYGCFYKLEELVEVNNEYEVQQWWPGYVIIGSDMGDSLWAYNPSKNIYCEIDSLNGNDNTYFCISNSFKEFLVKMDEYLEN